MSIGSFMVGALATFVIYSVSVILVSGVFSFLLWEPIWLLTLFTLRFIMTISVVVGLAFSATDNFTKD